MFITAFSHFNLIGIDLDFDSLSLAHALAEKMALIFHLKLAQIDAWNLPYNSELDLITSCGLNFYEPNPQRISSLYSQFFKALKPSGQLVIGFLTYPPGELMPSEWQVQKISKKDLFLEMILYRDILNMKWRNFRTSTEIETELKQVGFREINFNYDPLHVFPPITAKK